MKDARILIAVYECAEDAKAARKPIKEMWDSDYKKLYDNKEYDQWQLDKIIDIIDLSVHMVNNIGMEEENITKEIRILESSLGINIADRIQFMSNNDIPFTVVRNNNLFICVFPKSSQLKYIKLLKELKDGLGW